MADVSDDEVRLACRRDGLIWALVVLVPLEAPLAFLPSNIFSGFPGGVVLAMWLLLVAVVLATLGFSSGMLWSRSRWFLFGYQISATSRGIIIDTGHRTELLAWDEMVVTREVIPPFKSAMGVPRAYPVTGLGGEGVILERRHRLRRCGRWSDTANGQVGSVFIPEAGSENLDEGIAAQIWRFRPDLAAELGIARGSSDDTSVRDPQDDVQAEWVDAEPVPDGVVHEAFGHIVVQVNGPREVTVSGQLLPLVHATGTRKNVSLTVDGHPVAIYGARRGAVLTGYTSYLADAGENLLTLERNDTIRSSRVSLRRGRDFKRIGVVVSRHRGRLELSIRDRSDVTPAELAVGVAIAMLIGTRSFSPLNILNGI